MRCTGIFIVTAASQGCQSSSKCPEPITTELLSSTSTVFIVRSKVSSQHTDILGKNAWGTVCPMAAPGMQSFPSVFSGCLPVLCTPMALPHESEQVCRMCQCTGWTLTHGESMYGKRCHTPTNAWFSLLCDYVFPL